MREPDSRLGLYLAVRPRLLHYAQRILRSHEAAEDVVQEAYLRFEPAQVRAGAGTPGLLGGAHARNPAAYLFRIVRNLAIDAQRRQREVPLEAADESELATPAPTPEEALALREEADHARRLIAALPERERRAFEMHRFEGARLHEIARTLGVSVPTAQRLVVRAVARITLGLEAARVHGADG